MNLKRILVALLLVVTAFTLVACPDNKPKFEEKAGFNDDYTLLLQSSTMDGVFNPFFYSSAYDGDVVGLVNVGLLTLDPTGAVVAGNQYATAALSYEIYYTNNLTTYAKKEAYQAGDYVVYEIVLKNGDKFSDGRDITADDVLFNYYVYLDPAYNGSSTLYTLPILGLADYRTQVVNSAQFGPIAEKILADDGRKTGYVATAEYTEAQFNAYWNAFNQAGTAFAQEIVNYVIGKYATDAYVKAHFHPEMTSAEVKATPAMQVAYGMGMWGYGEISEDKLTLEGASGTVYNVSELTAEVYFNEMLLANADANGKVDYQELSDVESAGSDFVALASENFTSSFATLGSVPSIQGLVKGTKKIGKTEYETVKMILTEQNPKAILSVGVTVAPKHYYTAGYTPTTQLVNYGVEFNKKAFMDHLASFNGDPRGAGPYKFVEVNEQDGTVYFERNDYFTTMGGQNIFNAYIKKVALKIIESGAEYSALEAKSVHYATVSATADVMSDIGKQNVLVPILVDNLGYGYICINPQVFPDLNVRIGLASLMDTSKALDYYPNGLADIIHRSQSQVSWAYPEGAEAIYPFDGTKATAIARFKAAGFTFNETTQKFTNVPEGYFTFTLPSAADKHPAGGIFLRAQELLGEIGIVATIRTDASLIANIKKSPVGVYALAWGSAADPDMYQVYHYLSQAESVVSNGIKWLYENGTAETVKGTISVKKLDNTVVTMTQKEALSYLGELIEQGTKYMLAEERKPIYEKALEVLAQLIIELPTYQRKNLFVYDQQVIKGTTLSPTVTPYWGPLAEIWKVQFADGVAGNYSKEVEVKPAD